MSTQGLGATASKNSLDPTVHSPCGLIDFVFPKVHDATGGQDYRVMYDQLRRTLLNLQISSNLLLP